MIFTFCLLALFKFNYTYSQNLSECKCSYNSHYRLDRYLSEADSIGNTLSKKYTNIKIIGVRAFAQASLMFVVNDKGKNKGMCYDLMNKSHKILSGQKLDRFLRTIISDSIFLQKTKPLPTESLSKNFSYFISYDYPKSKIFEVCYSQLLRDINRPSSVALMQFPDALR
ncbi:hypothetical protein C7475_101912 [Chitinophaga sp. S165]|nr:hypothetical protein C7475_101912 [Chitinophaga sp. S165]